MANEITFGYITGKTLTYGAYQPDGTARTAAGTSLTETAGTGYYHATDASIAAGDLVVVKEGSLVVGFGEYKPEVSNTTVEDKVDIIDANVDTLIVDQQTVQTVDPIPEPVETRSRIYI